MENSTQILRFTTAGSVDDGKSTLIGRLLYDSKSIFEDQYEAIRISSERRGEDGVNLALLTDGLRAEREQGITIDVAYRYFSTPKRKFIIADTPGHIQYTRNMVTGASTANVALILVDARQGIIEQTRRHACIASLLQIPNIVLCINKMDLVNFDSTVFEKVKSDFIDFAEKLCLKNVEFIPLSALRGDNVVNRSTEMDWYQGPTLLYFLENVLVPEIENNSAARFPVQMVIRPMNDDFHDYRGYAGNVSGGFFSKGDKVAILPSGLVSKIAKIDTFDGELTEAGQNKSVTILLEDDIDISRGDMIVSESAIPKITQELEAMICWFNPRAMQLRTKYVLMHTTRSVRAIVKDINYKLDVNSLHKNYEDKVLLMNEIAAVTIKTTSPLFVDAYSENRICGSFILVDEGSNETIAAGMIL
jgi:sulfate adenylyltransferase subunit 1